MNLNNSNWNLSYFNKTTPDELKEYCGDSLLADVLALRGITGAKEAGDFIEAGNGSLHDPFLINEMDSACRRINAAISNGETVCVYGDYDVDGITSTCLLTDWFTSKGVKCVAHIPDRMDEGYGLNKTALDNLKNEGVSLVVTVDCGVTAFEEALYAKRIGLDMVITDHHECRDIQRPDAVAVIDCKRSDNTYPNPNLAGVGVAFKLISACEGSAEVILEKYVDLVCIGTVADVVPLIGENRTLVKLGIEKMANNPRLGVKTLIDKSSSSERRITSNIISYTIAPRLNATGRLGNTQEALDLLLSDDPQQAEKLAESLYKLNKDRQYMETEIFNEALNSLGDKQYSTPIILSGDNWHQGVIGIVASRLAEKFCVPVIMISFAGNEGKGSCRSYSNFNLFEALSHCSDRLIRFGGHALAAGLSIDKDELPAFIAEFNKYYINNPPQQVSPVSIDLLITDPGQMSVKSVEDLEKLEPFGNMNPKPVFCLSDVRIDNISAVGGGKHMKFSVSSSAYRIDCIFFAHSPTQFNINNGDYVDVAFFPQINEFHNNVSVQIIASALRKHEPDELCRLILDGAGNISDALRQYKPSRDDQIKVWRMLEKRLVNFGAGTGGIINSSPLGIKKETFCICIRAFYESGLLAGDDGSLQNAVINNLPQKVDLNETPVIKSLG